MTYHIDLRNTFVKTGVKFSNNCSGLSDENFKTHRFNNTICEVCGIKLLSVAPYLFSYDDASCVEYMIKSIIE